MISDKEKNRADAGGQGEPYYAGDIWVKTKESWWMSRVAIWGKSIPDQKALRWEPARLKKQQNGCVGRVHWVKGWD